MSFLFLLLCDTYIERSFIITIYFPPHFVRIVLSHTVPEMKKWISDPKCHFSNNGDDQSIHNYLFYTHQLPYAKAIPPRTGIVNTVGVDGAKIQKQFKEKEEGRRNSSAYDDVKGEGWIGDVDFLDYPLTDDEGYFINVDGKRSRVIHQYDRFGPPLATWLDKNVFNKS